MVSIKEIPHRNLPNQSELFLKYLELSPDALSFYSHAPVTRNLGEELQEKVVSQSFRRSELVSILRRQNRSYGCGPRTLDAIDRLEKPDCVAILTGQQVGLFTGPLYTIYKALTAVHLSNDLNARGFPAVPVFWMETEDHDLAEVTLQTILDGDGSIRTVDYRNALFENSAASNHPVGSIRFTDTIAAVVRDFADCLPESERKAGIRSMLDSSYVPGASFKQAFARLLHGIMQGSGLVLFDPQDPETKPLVSNIFQWAAEQTGEIHACISERNHELKSAGFQPQVYMPPKSTVLFHIDNGERRALEKRGSLFGLKNSDRNFRLQKLTDLIGSNPEKFSPNVLLRPIVQDTLFPTMAYVAGPAELAYFAQIEVLYALREKPMPVIWPRDGFTLLETEISRTMRRLGITPEDCFRGPDSLDVKVIQNSSPGRTGSGLDELDRNLNRTFREIQQEAEALDPSLPNAMNTAQRKIRHNIRKLKTRLLHHERAKERPLLASAHLVSNFCLPNGNLQERELNIMYFLSLYGPPILDAISAGVRTSGFSHHVLELD